MMLGGRLSAYLFSNFYEVDVAGDGRDCDDRGADEKTEDYLFLEGHCVLYYYQYH